MNFYYHHELKYNKYLTMTMKLLSETQIQTLIDIESKKKINDFIEKEKKQKNKAELYSLQLFLNKLVICVSNEMENVLVGYGKDITFITKSLTPKLIVYDLIEKKDVIPMGVIMNYSEQKFDALNSLDPNQRIAIFFNQFDENSIDKSSTKTSNILPANIWKQKVQLSIQEFFNQLNHSSSSQKNHI